VLRGGAWYFNAKFCRAAQRVRAAPSNRSDSCGFRPAGLLR
jgi:formylglycine-generating enzyme required for sulfatase activity